MIRAFWSRPFWVGLILRLSLPWYARGFRHMDEHWQVMEPANSFLHGAWSRTAEWEHGLRSWIYPWLVSLPMRLAEALGIVEPVGINAFTRATHGLVSALAIPLVYLTVRRLGPSQYGTGRAEWFARTAAWTVALWPFALYASTHTHGEMLGAVFVLAAVAAPVLFPLRADRHEWRAYALSGALFGAALALKIDVAVAGLGFGLWQLLHGRMRRAAALASGVLPLALAVGLIDKLTWGSWFHSVTGHARANLVDGIGNQWGVSPWYGHVLYYFDMLGAPALAAALALVARPTLWRKLPEQLRAVWFTNAFFVAAYCAVPHKEKRFLAPLLYTGELAAFATLAFAWEEYARPRAARYRNAVHAAFAAVLALLCVHGAANAVTYLVHQPWWDRISAIRDAGRIPGIQKMLSPQWPAVFYLPRGIAAETTGADERALGDRTRRLRDIGVAVDWKDLAPLARLGFRCEPWPAPPPVSADPLPWAYHCKRKR